MRNPSLSEDVRDTNKLLDYTNERLTLLQKNFQILNDCHHELELKYTRMETQLGTVVQIVKWFVSPGMALMIILELLKLGKVI